ncbi:MAG TPA: DNRLRE domain-containing protein [Verrucomicrobiae bacterium]
MAFPPRTVAVLAWLLCLGFGIGLRAETVVLFPSADATLIELQPGNSMGAGNFFNCGTTQNGNSNRALIKFDVAAAVPAGSTITDIGLYLTVTKQPVDGYNPSPSSLRRMLRPWGEGANPTPAFSPGFGLPASPGDATWSHASWGTNAWAVPGGLEGVDYSAAISTTAYIEGESVMPYFFESGGTIADVQFWLDHPESNFGWMLKSEDELSRFTARRFGSRELEEPTESPQLVITFLLPVVVRTFQAASNQIALTFNTDIGHFYRVERLNAFSETNSWTVLTNYGLVFAPGFLTARDSITGSQRFYRVRRD